MLLLLSGPAVPQAIQAMPCVEYNASISTGQCTSGTVSLEGSTAYDSYTYVYVAGYFNSGDGGQGGFTNNGTTGCIAGDHGSIIKDAGGYCWHRQNLDGSVEQFNAIPVTSGDGNASELVFHNAFQAAQAAGLGIVYIRGRPGTCSSGCGSRYQMDLNLTILQGMKLQCLSAPAGQSEASVSGQWQPTGYYGAIPFTLIVPYSQTILVGQAAQFQGCEVQQAGLDTPPTTTGPTYRYLENGVGGGGGVASFAGTAIVLGNGSDGTGDNAEVRDTTIIGFNTGIYSRGNSDIKITNVIDDSTRCLDIQKEDQGVATGTDIYCYPEMTRQVENSGNNVGLINLFASNISANSGVYRVTFNPHAIPWTTAAMRPTATTIRPTRTRSGSPIPKARNRRRGAGPPSTAAPARCRPIAICRTRSHRRCRARAPLQQA